MPFDYGETSPGDNDFVNQHPADERATRSAVKNAIDVEHDQAEGVHKFGVGNDAARDLITTWVVGSFWLNTSTTPATLQRVVSIGPVVWEDVNNGHEIPVGTKMAFFQAAVPTGWTLDATQHDKLLRVVNTSGGGTGGTWVFGGASVDNHTLLASEIPAHQHNISGFIDLTFTTTVDTGVTTRVWDADHVNNKLTDSNTGGGGGHNHNLVANSAYRPAYIDIIIGTKN